MLINRQEAISTGATRYFGKICAKHPDLNGERLVSNRRCVSCSKEKNQLSIKSSTTRTESRRKRNQRYKSKNKESIKEKAAKYRIENRLRISEHQRNRRHTDSMFAMKDRIRTLIRNSLRSKGYNKDTKTFEILGCTSVEFAIHIESQFTKGMNWDNRHLWEIDHIIPMDSAKTEEEAIKLNHHTNLRPLWAEDNKKKGAKIEHR